MEKLITVVVPIYNSEDYLKQCIDSILKQTYSNIELICVDDGSEDKSIEIITEYIQQDKRVRLLKQEHKGAGAARNMGMDRAKGEYIIFLDSDDFFDSSMFKKMYDRAEETNADIVMCGCKTYDAQSETYCDLSVGLKVQFLPKKEPFSVHDITEHIYQVASGWAWDKLYRLDFIRRKEIRFQEILALNDGLFVDLAAVEADKIATVREQLVSYRMNRQNSITSTRYSNWHCIFDMIYEKRTQLKARGYYEIVKRSYINNALGLLTVWIDKFNVCNEGDEFFAELKKLVKILKMENYSEDYYYSRGGYQCVVDIVESENALMFWLTRKERIIIGYESYIEQMRRKKIWLFPQERFEKGTSFLVYGYGDVGKDFCRQISNANMFELVAVVDQKYELYRNEPYNIIGIEDISKYDYDYILIAILNEGVAEEVKNNLIEANVDEEKIKWLDIHE